MPINVRYLAIIQLKNGIDKYWRKTAANAVSKDERALIRSRLLSSGFSEIDRRLLLQNALMTAKIVRFEYPNDWPDALTQIIGALRPAAEAYEDFNHLSGALLMLLYIVKELSTARLQSKRASLQAVSPEILHVLGRIFITRLEVWKQQLSVGGADVDPRVLNALEQSLLSIKILRRLVVAGYAFPNRDKDVQEFWVVIRNQLGSMLNISVPWPQCQKIIEKHQMQFAKFHLDMAQTHPAAFVLLPDSLSLVADYWGLITKFGESYGARSPVTSSSKIGADGDADDERPLIERLSLKGLLLVRACVKMVFNPAQTFKYRQPQEKEEKKQATDLLKQQLLTEAFVKQAMEITVTRFFVMRAADLKEWEDEPEEWEKREEAEGEGFEYSIRACAEKLFMDLAINFKALLIEPLLNVFYSVACEY